MGLEKSYVFDDPAGLDYDDNFIAISDAARLKMQQSPVSFSQDFASSTGFTFDSALVEFVGGILRQKDLRPANNTFWASFASSMDGNWGGGTLTATNHGATLNTGTGRIELLGGASQKYVDWIATGNGDSLQVGCSRIKVIPNYSGTPATNQFFLRRSQANGSNNNVLGFFHASTGQVSMRIFNSAGVSIITVDLGLWAPVSGTQYEWEMNWDITTGATRLFLNGTQFGATQTATGTRSGAVALMRSGEAQTLAGATAYANFSITSIQLFSTVQHTANYTPGADPSETIYGLSASVLPEMAHVGAGTFLEALDFSTVETAAPHYSIQIGQSGTYLYWNGSAWVTSDGSYAQANTQATIDANIATLPVSDELYIQFKVHFQASNTQQQVDTLTVQIQEETGFSLVAQKMTPQGRFEAIKLISFVESADIPASTHVRYILEVDSQKRWWDGSVWSTSDGSFEESNTAQEVEDHLVPLVDQASFVKVIFFLKTDDEALTPELTSAVIEYSPNTATMRSFLDSILGFIGAESLTDEEFAFDEIQALTEQEYSQEVYDALKLVLNTREAVSSMHERLTDYFEASGLDLDSSSNAPSSNILVGAVLE